MIIARVLLWDESTSAAFIQIKQALASVMLLTHPKPDALTNIMTDASDIAVGAALQQFIDAPFHSSPES